MSKPRRKRRWLRIVSVGVLLLTGSLLTSFAAGLIDINGVRIPVAAADRDLAVTESDLAEVLGGFSAVDNGGTLVKRRMFDGGVTLEYRKSGKSPNHRLLDLVSKFWMCRDAAQSELFFDAAAVVTQDSFNPLGFNVLHPGAIERHDEWLAWGDESACASLMVEGQVRGTFFVARKGRMLVHLWISGVGFTEPEAFRRLLSSRLERFEAEGL